MLVDPEEDGETTNALDITGAVLGTNEVVLMIDDRYDEVAEVAGVRGTEEAVLLLEDTSDGVAEPVTVELVLEKELVELLLLGVMEAADDRYEFGGGDVVLTDEFAELGAEFEATLEPAVDTGGATKDVVVLEDDVVAELVVAPEDDTEGEGDELAVLVEDTDEVETGDVLLDEVTYGVEEMVVVIESDKDDVEDEDAVGLAGV